MRRFYFPALAAPDAGPSDQSPLVLTGPEARHLALVLRLKAGDTVEFFDGLGQVVQARLQSVTPQQVRAVPVAAHAGRADSCPDLVLAQALLKGRKMDLVVQKANELGVQRLLPLVTQFCEKREGGAAALARWQRIVIESCKQCRRALPMQIAAPAPLAGADFSWAKTRLVAWEGEHEAGLPFAPLEPAAGPLCLLVAPGFTGFGPGGFGAAGRPRGHLWPERAALAFRRTGQLCRWAVVVMRAVVQRVSHAAVRVAGRETGAIDSGLLVFLGVQQSDGAADAAWLLDKILNLRIFEDPAGLMNRSLLDTAGALLVVSQFTVLGDCRRGRRPSWHEAAPPEQARALYEHFLALARSCVPTECGQFQSTMQVSLVNDGPVTILLDSHKLF